MYSHVIMNCVKCHFITSKFLSRVASDILSYKSCFILGYHADYGIVSVASVCD